MIPPQLTNLFETYDYEDLKLSIIHVDWDEEPLTLDFAVRTAYQSGEEVVNERWKVEVVGHREDRISFDYGESVLILQEHPLLWKFTDWQCNLYFSGTCADPAKLFYHMYHLHVRLFASFVPFEAFLNLTDFERLFKLQGGLIAKGPRKLLQQYAKCLEEQGLGWSIIDGYRPTFWNGESHQPESSDLKILLVAQTNTYVIAEDFIFSQQTPMI